MSTVLFDETDLVDFVEFCRRQDLPATTAALLVTMANECRAVAAKAAVNDFWRTGPHSVESTRANFEEMAEMAGFAVTWTQHGDPMLSREGRPAFLPIGR